jgi:hypothetical protein
MPWGQEARSNDGGSPVFSKTTPSILNCIAAAKRAGEFHSILPYRGTTNGSI